MQIRSPAFALGLALLGLTLCFVLLGPFLWSADPTLIDMRARSQGISLAHPMGTDQLGRDLMARLMVGGRITLAVGFVSMVLAVGLGTLIGVAAGYLRLLDNPLMRLTDLGLSLPLLPLLLLMVMLFRDPLANRFGAGMGMFVLIILAIALTSWMQTARLVRAEVIALKTRDYIQSAHAIGLPDLRIVWHHILPAIAGPLLVTATLSMAQAVITESALSFLGLGFPPDTPTWGRILQEGMGYMTLAPGRVLWPALMISGLILAIQLVTDGLRARFDPRISRR